MRAFLLFLVVVLALCHVSSAAQFQNVTFYSDVNCTTAPLNLATLYNLTDSASWPAISSASVADNPNPTCAAVSIGAVQSGTYECITNSPTGPDGFLVTEFSQAACAGAPVALYAFLNAPGMVCIPGTIETFPDPTGAPVSTQLFAQVQCSYAASGSSSSSSSGAVAVSSSSSSSASPSPPVTPSVSSSSTINTTPAKIQSVTFWNDSACSTTPLNIGSLYNLTDSASWPNISSSLVYDSQAPQCAAVNIGAVQSGTYECQYDNPGVTGLLVMEYPQAGCVTPLAAIYEFFGPPGATCLQGEVEIFNATGGIATTVQMYAKVLCSSPTAVAPSSSSAVVLSSSSSSAGSTSVIPLPSVSSSPNIVSSSTNTVAAPTSAPSSSSATPSASTGGSVTSAAPVIVSNGAAERSGVVAALLAAVVLVLSMML